VSLRVDYDERAISQATAFAEVAGAARIPVVVDLRAP